MCVFVGGNGRERESVANIFFRFSTSFNMFFFLLWKRDKKNKVCEWEWWWERIREV